MRSGISRIVAVATIVLVSVAGVALSAEVDMQEGEWETTVEMTMLGGPMSMPPVTSKATQCITREDLVPDSGRDKECRVTRHKVVGNKVTWSVVCGKTEGEGEITYKGSTYKGTVKMKTVEDGETITTLMKLSGRRTGPCPAGKKEAASKEAEKYKAMAEDARIQGERKKAEQAEINRKTGEFIQKNPVPAEEPGACAEKGFVRRLECDRQVGKLDFEPGEYELTIEKASRIGTICTPVEVKKKTLCLILTEPVPADIREGRKIKDVMRGKDRITWKDDSAAGIVQGGIVYKGNSFKGVATHVMGRGTGSETLHVTKVTGRRLGDGNCLSGSGGGLDYTSRERKEKERETGAGEKGKDLLKNPVKGIRDLFGY